MLTNMPANRTQMWLSRGAIAVLVLLLILLNTVGMGSVTSVKQGDITVHSGSPLGPIFFGALGIITCVLAAVYWTQQSRFYRAVSVALGAMSLYIFFNAPSGINHRVVVAPGYFFHRVGSWYSPIETKVDFDSVVYMTVDEAQRDRNRRKTYELHCIAKKGTNAVRIPIYDLMKKALPEILERAAQRDIIVGERPDGRVIPSDI